MDILKQIEQRAEKEGTVFLKLLERGFNNNSNLGKATFGFNSEETKEAQAKYGKAKFAREGKSTFADANESQTDWDIVTVTNIRTEMNRIIALHPIINLVKTEVGTVLDLVEFGNKPTAQRLAESGSKTDTQKIPMRQGDTLRSNKRTQVEIGFSDYLLKTASPEILGEKLAMGTEAVADLIAAQILSGNNTGNNYKGWVNAFGTTTDDQEGALAYTSTELTPVTKIRDMMGAVASQRRDARVFIAREADVIKLRNSKDSGLVVAEGLGCVQIIAPHQYTIDGIPVVLEDLMAAGRFLYADLSTYTRLTAGPVEVVEDVSSIRNAEKVIVIREWSDGGMTMSHKNAVGSAAGSNDNLAYNVNRYIDITF